MAILQVRDLPEDIYVKLSYLAKKDKRSVAQETIVLLKDSIEKRFSNGGRRKEILENYKGLNLDTNELPDPISLIREDRER